MAKSPGRLISHLQDEIEAIGFVPFPSRPSSKFEKIVRVDGMIFARLDARTVACSRDLKGFAYPPNSRSFPWMETVLRGLRALGCISQKGMNEHLARCKANGEREARKYAIGQLKDAAKELGIELTAAQQRNLQP